MMRNACVLPAMLYASEKWILTGQSENKVKAAPTKIEISILNLHTGIIKKTFG